MISVEVKKSKNRQFLVFCAELALADKEFRPMLWQKAVDQGIVVERMRSEIKAHDQQEFFHPKFSKFKNLACNIKRMAEKITERNDFYVVVFLPTHKFLIEDRDYCHGDKRYIGGVRGRVRYVEKPENEEAQIAADRWDLLSFEDCDYDISVGVFLDALEEYKQVRGIGYFEIPLRLCEWCSSVFFGKRHDQRFCCRDHSQRWHAKNSYLKKKRRESK